MSLAVYIIGLICLIALSAFFSASEMAFSSANRLRIENTMENGGRGGKSAFAVLERYDDTLSTILIGNNLVNISASSASTVIAIVAFGEEYTALVTAIVTVLIIIFGETMPKIVAKKNANRLSLSIAWILRALMFILKPLIAVVTGLVRLITKPMKGEAASGDQEAVDELFSIIETVEDEGVIDEDRSELLQAALDFSDISAREVMTSRVDMEAIDLSDSRDEIVNTIENSDYSRLPVYEDSIDNIIGVLYLNHYYKARLTEEEPDIRSLLISPCYVYKTVKLPAVLAELRRSKMHMAIVTDDYGGTMGTITMEDVLEQIVGEIWDEKDEVSSDIAECGQGQYEVNGALGIYELLDFLGLDEDEFETESATVGGWTLEICGRFPTEGETFTTRDGLTVTVLAMDGLRVAKVLISATS